MSLVTRHLSLLSLARPFQLDRLLDEVEAASAAYLFNVAAVNGEEATLRGAIFVDAAGCCVVAVLLEEGTLEKYLAASAATIALAASQAERLDDFLMAEACLLGAKLRVFDGASALGRHPLLERAPLRRASGWSCFHHPRLTR